MAILKSHHIAMKSPNYAETRAFYAETLGFPIVGSFPGTLVVFIDIGGTTIELSPTDLPALDEAPKVGLAHVAWEVDDMDATYQELVAKGVEFTIVPRASGDTHFAFFLDPDGNELELFRNPNRTGW